MQNRSQTNIKKALRKLSTPWTTAEEVEASLSAVNDESDRGMLLLVATQLEDILTHYVSEKLDGLTIEEREGFLGPEGPAGAFGVKIKLAIGMKIIDRPTYEALEMIRCIRNASAHALHPVTLETPIIKEAILSLVDESIRERYQRLDKDVMRLVFRMACLNIQANITEAGAYGNGLLRLTQDLTEMEVEA